MQILVFRIDRGIARLMVLMLALLPAFNSAPSIAAGKSGNETPNIGKEKKASEKARAANTESKESRESRKDSAQTTGTLTVFGTVTLNDKRAINGTTILTDSRIKVACAQGNRAIVNLGQLGKVELNPGTQLMLRFSDGLISGDLLEGNIVVNSPAGVKVAINTAEGVQGADGAQDTVMPVRTQRGVRCVPMVMSSSGSSSALGAGALAAIFLGAGAVSAIGAIVSTDNGDVVSPVR